MRLALAFIFVLSVIVLAISNYNDRVREVFLQINFNEYVDGILKIAFEDDDRLQSNSKSNGSENDSSKPAESTPATSDKHSTDGASPTQAPSAHSKRKPDDNTSTAWPKADRYISELESGSVLKQQETLRTLFGQIFMIGTQEYRVRSFEQSLIAGLIRNKNIGNVIMRWRSVNNSDFFNPRSQGDWHSYAQKLNSISATSLDLPLLIAADHEGGATGGFARTERGVATDYPPPLALGSTRNKTYACKAGIIAADDILDLGFNTNLAPVLDVHFNAEENIIGDRSFGAFPGHVATMGNAFMNGLQERGVVSVSKHYPGHGHTEEGIESPGIVESDLDLETLEVSLDPFRHAVRNGTDMIMTAYFHAAALSDKNIAFDSKLIDLLRASEDTTISIRGKAFKGMGFKGPVVADDLQMAGFMYANEKPDIDKAPVLTEKSIKLLESGHNMLMFGNIQAISTDEQYATSISAETFKTIYQNIYSYFFDSDILSEKIQRLKHLRESILHILKVKKNIRKGHTRQGLTQEKKRTFARKLWDESFVYKISRRADFNITSDTARISIYFPTGYTYSNSLTPSNVQSSFDKWTFSGILGEKLKENNVFFAVEGAVKFPDAVPNCPSGKTRRECRADWWTKFREELNSFNANIIIFIVNTRGQWYRANYVLDQLSKQEDPIIDVSNTIIIPINKPTILTSKPFPNDAIRGANIFIPFNGYQTRARYAVDFLLNKMDFSRPLGEAWERTRNIAVIIDDVQRTFPSTYFGNARCSLADFR